MNVVRAFPNLSFLRPLFLTYAPDGSDRIFVVEQGKAFANIGANIYVFPNSDSVTTAQRKVFLNILPSRAGNEEGLLGFAFDPDYRNNGYFYVNYSLANPRRSVLSRFSVDSNDPDKANPNSEKILLTLNQPHDNHNGGMIAFGPDDMLYTSFGDGGSGGDPQNNGQNLGTLLGTIIRIDPHGTTGNLNYGIPNDNPYVNTSGARGEIWGYGLRNAWRFSFDRNTGDIWIADVGQNQWEEINFVARNDLLKGGNFGWRWFEGTSVFVSGAPANLGDIKPIHEYNHNAGRSITGGYVYRGTKNPTLRGAYLFADYATQRIWALTGSGASKQVVELATLSSPSSFGEDEAGEVYLTSLNGTIHRLVEKSTSNDPPFPKKLSETGLFVDTAAMIPHPKLLPYDVNETFWSDNALKARWIHLPDPASAGKITFSASGTWQFPEGTVLVKHFEILTEVGVPTSVVRLETRVLVKEVSGWQGYVYKWNTAGTDADLLSDRDTRLLVIKDPRASGGQYTQLWEFPSRANCTECHGTGWEVLGVRTRQMNRIKNYRPPVLADNQIDIWKAVGMFGNSVGSGSSYGAHVWSRDVNANIDDRARVWLAVNCAMCHYPGGPGGGNIDLRYTTALTSTGLINQPPQRGSLGIQNAVLVKPGSKSTSVLWERLRRLDGNRMPPLASHLVDQEAVDLIGAWIDQLK